MNSNTPIISGPQEVYCLETFQLEATVDGDPGAWTVQGPGNAVFSNNEAANTSVTVDQYGEYIFTYNGCGANSDIMIYFLI